MRIGRLICVGVFTIVVLSAASPANAVVSFDQNVTPEVIFGSGNANGAFTVDRQNGVELGLRAKTRFPVPMNVFNSNGDGTYNHPPLAGNPSWNFEWTVNSDWNNTSGFVLSDLTYEIGLDFDSGPGTNFLAWDQITVPSFIPFIPPVGPIPVYDHAMGDNSTANGAGVGTADPVVYQTRLDTLNVTQNSWRLTFFDSFPFDIFDPTVSGVYDVYLKAFRNGTEVASVTIQVLVGTVGACCDDGPGTVSDCIQSDQTACEGAGGLYLGDSTLCSAVADCTPLLVEFESISARRTAQGVLIEWATSVELETVGFRILRETSGSREKALELVAPMIPAAGNGFTGASYEFLDRSAPTRGGAVYYIEDVDLNGKVTRHGPIVVHRNRGLRQMNR